MHFCFQRRTKKEKKERKGEGEEGEGDLFEGFASRFEIDQRDSYGLLELRASYFSTSTKIQVVLKRISLTRECDLVASGKVRINLKTEEILPDFL